jgi:hypothetical protein
MMTYAEYLMLQREAMLRHKWIESEKAGRDLGQDALFDWIEKHAAAFHCAAVHRDGVLVEGDANGMNAAAASVGRACVR